ncbi:MAG: glycoside hydrolase family 13 protein [Ignavibacteriaceae bacterium]|nr:glycoside hydrolase family 13 protein [Ignavibacteriaceae bacterium]
MIKYFFFFVLTFSFFAFGQPVPEWSKGIVWYQIFPERFANGDKQNDPGVDKVFSFSNHKPGNWEVTPWTSNWFAQQQWEKDLGGAVRNHLYERRYGGDIRGILDNLDYIKELGAGAIYLNPVFEAVSLHKYDGSTFHHIDVNFGPDPDGDKKLMEKEIPDNPSTWVWTEADKIFLELIKQVHTRGMKIVIDGVFNHTGVQFWAFQDVVKNGEESKFKDWYKIKKFDNPATIENEFDYDGWWNIKSLPEFNRTENDLNAGPKQYIFTATKRWMDPNDDGDPADGIDGWRLDVAREVPIGFWNDWRKLVLSVNNDAIIIGELWELSPDFISGNGPFDALMNYNFAYAVKDFFINVDKKIKASAFIDELKKVDENYPDDNLYALQNLMDSHDTERLLSLIENPDRKFDRDANEENISYNAGKPSQRSYEIEKLVLAFQMTYRGAPMIYYGDEIGMWGADDPHNRKPMVWDTLKYDDEVIDKSSGFNKGFGKFKIEQNKSVLSFYKKMIGIRNQNSALQKGSQRFLYSNDETGVVVFERKLGSEWVICVFNSGENEANIQLPLEGNKLQYEDLWGGEEGMISSKQSSVLMDININAISFKIIKLYPAL